MNATTATTAPANVCAICGTPGASDANPFPKHDLAVHEVYAFENWGMHAVKFEARPYVQSWSTGTHRLPTREEWDAKFGVVVDAEAPVERQDRLAREYGVQESGLAVGHEYHSSVEGGHDHTLAEVKAAGGRISRVRLLKEYGRCDISYIHATLPGDRVVRVSLSSMPTGSTCLWMREVKGAFIAWANEEGVSAKGLGLLDEGNWSVLG